MRSDAYILDKMRRRVLAGLTPEETREFELLDAQLAFDAKPICCGTELSSIEYRWFQLFEKMRRATLVPIYPEQSEFRTDARGVEALPELRNDALGLSR